MNSARTRNLALVALLVAAAFVGTVFPAGCGKVDSTPVEPPLADIGVDALRIEPAAQAVPPGGLLSLTLVATERGGGPAPDGSTITVTADSLGTVDPPIVSTAGGRATATFKAGVLTGDALLTASSRGGASHSVRVKVSADAAAPPPTPSNPTPSNPAAPSGGDDLDLSRVTKFIVINTPGVTADKVRAAKVTAKITGASTNGRFLYTKYEPYDFPERDGCDAVCYFFYVSGNTVVGGKFDYWRTGGQPTKGLENVEGGYGGHRMPSRGTECWTMISSLDGSQRSNTRKVEWK